MGKRKQDDSQDAQTKKVKVEDEKKAPTPKEVSVALQLPELSQEKKTSIDVKDKSVITGEWAELHLDDRIVRHLVERMELTKPTVIQKLAIPHLLEKKDVLMKSQTGSGKTLCYALSALQELSSIEPKINRTEGSYVSKAVIIVPTRELALQTYEVLTQVCRAVNWIVPGVLMGGEKKTSEKARLRKGVTMLVSTPGRLLDHLRTTESFIVENLRWVILDEADRLLDMGFEKDVTTIMSELKSRIKQIDKPLQTALISATIDSRVQNLASQLLNDPVNIYLETPQSDVSKEGAEEHSTDQHSTPRSLRQFYVLTPLKQKLGTLSAFLRWKSGSIENCKIIVFFSNCDSVDFHYALLNQTRIKSENSDDTEPLVKVPIFKLHGNLPQQERMKVFQDFRKSSGSILLCTDVAARGMDIIGIDWTVQYDAPGEPKEYVHRVGRAARAGREGNSLLFLTPVEEGYISLLHGFKLSPLPVDQILSKVGDPNLLQLCYESMLLVDPNLMSMSKQAYFATLRAYSTHSKETKQIFHIKKLHLGHLAKSFALRDTPTQFKVSEQKRVRDNYNSEKIKNKDKMTKKKFRSYDSVSEFASAIDQ